MSRSQILALALIVLAPRPAAAQLTIEPGAPRWGDSITITAEPTKGASDNDRFDGNDHLFARIGTARHGVASADVRWTAMTWDGRRFVAHVTLPNGCEAGNAHLATAERSIGGYTPFVCRTAEGTLPPGALIEGLTWGDRDRTHWQ